MREAGCGINDYIAVKLTDNMKKELKRQHDELNKQFTYPWIPDDEYLAPKEDADGWSTWFVWDFMNRLQWLSLGREEPLKYKYIDRHLQE